MLIAFFILKLDQNYAKNEILNKKKLKFWENRPKSPKNRKNGEIQLSSTFFLKVV